MKRNFCVHPKDVLFNDIVASGATGSNNYGFDTTYVNYTINKSNIINTSYYIQNVKFESVDCALSNSIIADVKLVIFKPNTSTALPSPFPYYICNSIGISATRPYINLWLKNDKNPSSYYFTHITNTYVTIHGTYRECAFFSLNKIENITPFDTFQICFNCTTPSNLDIIGTESTGTTANSRNNVSPFNPFFINTYWKN